MSTSGCPLPRLYVIEAGADATAPDAAMDVTRSEDTVIDPGDGGLADVPQADASRGNDACDPDESPCGCPSDCGPNEPAVPRVDTYLDNWQNYGAACAAPSTRPGWSI